MTHRHTRRNFLLTGLTVAGGVIGTAACQNTSPPASSEAVTAEQVPTPVPPAPVAAEMPVRTLGRTDVSLPLLGLGGSASPLSRPQEEAQAMDIIHRALELGIRYFDTASNYGPSETFLGKVLPAHRAEVFIATKTSQRSRDDAWRELEQSLQRLQTD
ncbi:MAG: aldo/keto reductase, partial [Cyanobacteria bacterium Co-bin13]|nr:aldo/keto reductase [Cyanobacteria bacterium Co-bin13]